MRRLLRRVLLTARMRRSINIMSTEVSRRAIRRTSRLHIARVQEASQLTRRRTMTHITRTLRVAQMLMLAPRDTSAGGSEARVPIVQRRSRESITTDDSITTIQRSSVALHWQFRWEHRLSSSRRSSTEQRRRLASTSLTATLTCRLRQIMALQLDLRWRIGMTTRLAMAMRRL